VLGICKVFEQENRRNRHEPYDVAIIGAGPAGAMLARLIGQRYRVLLVEYLLKSLKSRVVFHPGLRRIIMRLGLRNMDICGREEIEGTT
jgi:2-polyprenyl-6-methoxyphenol hydroxylase-like FAD-dependent oxidoreductase